MNKEKSNVSRQSGVELLKIIAVFMIILSHILPYSSGFYNFDSSFDFNAPPQDVQSLFVIFFCYLGQFGNVIFIICSAYFLCRKDRKADVKKIINIIADVTAVSLIFLICILASGYRPSVVQIVRSVFPVIFARYTNWYVACYILLCLAHPLLNLIIHSLSRRQLLTVNLVLFITYFVFCFFENFFSFSNIIGFVCIYFFTAYIKLYMPVFRQKVLINSILLVLSLIATVCLLILTAISGGQMLSFKSINNPFILTFGISAFNLFSRLKFKSAAVNYLSSLSLLMYIIHRNHLFIYFVQPLYFEYVYRTFTYDCLLAACFIGSVAAFFVSALLAAAYKETLGALIKKLTDKIYPPTARAANKLLDRLLKDRNQP